MVTVEGSLAGAQVVATTPCTLMTAPPMLTALAEALAVHEKQVAATARAHQADAVAAEAHEATRLALFYCCLLRAYVAHGALAWQAVVLPPLHPKAGVV
jgi:hypothetical protein